jgi:hypothetical protein
MLPTRRNKDAQRSNPYRKAVAELAEIRSTHSAYEMVNNYRGKEGTVGQG